MNKSFFLLALVAVLAVGAGCSNTDSVSDTTATGPSNTTVTQDHADAADYVPEDSNAGTSDVVDSDDATPTVQEFIVEGGNFSFEPSAMHVKKGDTVHITFKNIEGFHDLKIDEFNVATAQLQAGGEQTVEFVADKAGSFEYYCSVGKHREMGMKGTLIVEE